MTKKSMEENRTVHPCSLKKALRCFAAVMIAVCLMFVGAVGAEGAVAKVGDTEYSTIDEAISNWGNNQELTLLADVTLSDTITLKSDEKHTLNLGTYTMTAASGKNAIQINREGGDAACDALIINADAENPGGITATGKYCIYYNRNNKIINDMPIITINGGVFNGNYAVYIYSYTNEERNIVSDFPYVYFNGGEFNAKVNLNRAKVIISGGHFTNR